MKMSRSRAGSPMMTSASRAVSSCGRCLVCSRWMIVSRKPVRARRASAATAGSFLYLAARTRPSILPMASSLATLGGPSSPTGGLLAREGAPQRRPQHSLPQDAVGDIEEARRQVAEGAHREDVAVPGVGQAAAELGVHLVVLGEEHEEAREAVRQRQRVTAGGDHPIGDQQAAAPRVAAAFQLRGAELQRGSDVGVAAHGLVEYCLLYTYDAA